MKWIRIADALVEIGMFAAGLYCFGMALAVNGESLALQYVSAGLLFGLTAKVR